MLFDRLNAMLGFILKHLGMTDDELPETKDRLEVRRGRGFVMRTIYIEDAATTPAAFAALIEAVNRDEATAVVVPSLLHFAALSAVHNIKDTFERATGAHVTIASSSPLMWWNRCRSSLTHSVNWGTQCDQSGEVRSTLDNWAQKPKPFKKKRVYFGQKN